MKYWNSAWIQIGLGQKKKKIAGNLLEHLVFYSTELALEILLPWEKELLQRKFLRFKYNRWYFRSSVNCICVRTPNLDSLHSHNLWQSMAFCCNESLAHPLMEAWAGNFIWPRSPSFPIKDGSVWLLFGSRYKLTRVSDLFHPVHDKSCWQPCGCCRRPWYYMGYHFRPVRSFISQHWLVPGWGCSSAGHPLSCLRHVYGNSNSTDCL